MFSSNELSARPNMAANRSDTNSCSLLRRLQCMFRIISFLTKDPGKILMDHRAVFQPV